MQCQGNDGCACGDEMKKFGDTSMQITPEEPPKFLLGPAPKGFHEYQISFTCLVRPEDQEQFIEQMRRGPTVLFSPEWKMERHFNEFKITEGFKDG